MGTFNTPFSVSRINPEEQQRPLRSSQRRLINILDVNFHRAMDCQGPDPSLTYSKTSYLRELAYVRLHPVEGRNVKAAHSPKPKPQPGPSDSSKATDFQFYSDSDEDDEGKNVCEKISRNVVDYLKNRELTGGSAFAGGRLFTHQLNSEFGTRQLLVHGTMKEMPINLPSIDKIFCSQWLSHRQIIFGTKCNKLMVYDVNRGHLDSIPTLEGLHSIGGILDVNPSRYPDSNSGIHAIQINPSRTLLATGGRYASDIAVYRLPTLDPVCVGQNAHKDWIFDLTWLDDQFVVSCSRDGTMALWRITDNMLNEIGSLEIPTHLTIQPSVSKRCKNADRVRAACFNSARNEIVAISTNAYIHCWDGLRFHQMMSKKLPHQSENVCIAVDETSSSYAVGSKANVDILDSRTLQATKRISSSNRNCGIRSVSYKGNILTIGTGIGLILFWDARAEKFLESAISPNRAVQLKTSLGWVPYNEPGFDPRYNPAVYTHSYDSLGLRLFAAGGPLQCNAQGNYAAIFQ